MAATWHRLVAFLVGAIGAGLASASPPPAVMPLAEVRPGMKGEWKTVVQGTTIRGYELEVLGVLENFRGPGQHLIVAQATDAENLLSGPVGGMSGSPVFIDGRLVGAYAIGFAWPKEQAVIGITPIADMLTLVEEFPLRAPEPRAPSLLPAPPPEIGSGPHTLAPLSFGGFSPATLDAFTGRINGLGWRPLAAGGTGESAVGPPTEPGSAVAAVLMDGDFSVAATGTVTWSDGERVLGFGHPFASLGQVELPLAGAEVVTVIRNLESSFKLVKPGPVVGTIYQDRLTGIAGRVGPLPPMTDLKLDLQARGYEPRQYRARLFRHPEMTSLLAAMALFEASSNNLTGSSEQTFLIEGTVTTDDGERVGFQQAAVGANGLLPVAFGLLSDLQGLQRHPERPVGVRSIDLVVSTEDALLTSRLESVVLDRSQLVPGGEIGLRVTVGGFQAPARTAALTLHLPEDLRPGETLRLFVGDGPALDRLLDAAAVPTRTVEQYVRRWAERRPPTQAYVALLREQRGVRLRGEDLPALPPSVAASLRQPTAEREQASISLQVADEERLPVGSVFSGQYTRELKVR